MRAIVVDEPGGLEHLVFGEVPTPEPGADELLVRVEATALNRADLYQRRGKYPPPEGASPLLGLEVAGRVATCGKRCEGFSEGDRVFGLLPGGGYAEYARLHQSLAMPIPKGLSYEEAAAVPEVFLTAYQALVWLGELTGGERVLIHAGASGVGTAALQIARELGATSFVTASAPKHELCYELGAHLAIDYRREDFAGRIQEETGGEGVDVIVDFIGAPYFSQNVEALALDGRIVLLALMGGYTVEPFDMRSFFRKRARLQASTLRNRSISYKAELTHTFREELLGLFQEGRLRPVIDSVYDWAEVAKAHARMEANENAGKIILRVG